MKKPLILISNDDGIRAAGISAICSKLVRFAEVVVAAPDTQKSGASHAISIQHLLTARRVKMYGAVAYAINGTPADCAKLGIFNLCKREPDLVVSGINHGPNFGKFIIYSGTVGAAAEAALLGIPALSISLDDYESKEPDFTVAAEYGAKIAGLICEKKLIPDRHTIINVNIPGPGAMPVKGIKVVPRDTSRYEEYFVKKTVGGKAVYRWHIDERKRGEQKGITDTDAVRDGFVTVTPLHFELTHFRSVKNLAAQLKKITY